VTISEFRYTALCYELAVHRPSVSMRINTANQMTHTDLTVSDKRCEGSRCSTEVTQREVPSDYGRLK